MYLAPLVLTALVGTAVGAPAPRVEPNTSIADRDNGEQQLPQSAQLCNDVGLRGNCQTPHFDAVIEQRSEDDVNMKVSLLNEEYPVPGNITYCIEANLKGNCTSVNLWNKCSGKIRYVKSLHQDVGAVCKYHVHPGCDDRWPKEINTYEKAYTELSFGSFPFQSISCGRKNEETTYALNTRDIDTGILDNTDFTSGTSLLPGSLGTVWACTEQNFFKCAEYSALNSCKNLDRSIGAKSLRQSQKSICTWYEGWGCSAADPTVIDQVEGIIGRPDVGDKDFKSVKCVPDENETVGPRDTDALVPSEDPGTVTACADKNYGKCVPYMALDVCKNLDRSNGISSLRQAQGAVCYWHRGWGCADSDPLEKPSGKDNIDEPDLLNTRKGIKSVICRISEEEN